MNTIKTFLPLFCMLLCGTFAQAQKEIEEYVISTSGKTDTLRSSSSADLYFVDWTIGEPLTEMLSGSRKILTQGFHQRSTIAGLESISTYIFSRLDQDSLQHFSVFPNPFVSMFSVRWNFSENIFLNFEIYNMNGRRLFFKRQTASDMQLQIELHDLKPATYILRISDPLRNFAEAHKIIKI